MQNVFTRLYKRKVDHMTVQIGILGYGNIGRGVETALLDNPDVKLAAVFTRRDPAQVKIATAGVPVVSVNDIAQWTDKIDVLVLAGGSATDLPVQTPKYASLFNVIDTFDTHAHIPQHFAAVDAAAKAAGKVAMISVGWDPGLFSLARLYGNVLLPDGKDYTFWGKGVSQGHSDAIRRIKGVKNGKQYTIPVEAALEAVRAGKNPELTTRQKHTRECFVVLEEGADAAKVEEEIKTMPNYFSDYDTTVHFISEEEFNKNHQGLPMAVSYPSANWREQGKQPRDRIPADLGFQPGIHRSCSDCLCKSPGTAGQGRGNGLQDCIRYCSCLFEPSQRRRTAGQDAVKQRKRKSGFLWESRIFFVAL